MNISVLPAEILADIVARLDNNSIFSVLHVNKKFNKLVQRYKPYKPVAKNIEFSCSTNGVRLVVTWHSIDHKPPNTDSISIGSTGNKDRTQIMAMAGIVAFFKKLNLRGTESVDIQQLENLDLNLTDIFKRANVSLSNLETCRANTFKMVRTPLITKSFINVLAACKPKMIYFRNCITGFRIEDVFNCIEEHLETAPRSAEWHFGVFGPCNYSELREMIDRFKERNVKVTRNFLICDYSPGIRTIQIKNDNTKATFMWQENAYLT